MASLLIKKAGNSLSITLNRPKALNSLDVFMAMELRDKFLEWKRSHPDFAAIVVKGSGGMAFCAGGDVKSIWTEVNAVGHKNPLLGTGSSGFLQSSEFFKKEYEMNYLIGTSTIPQVSLWDGIVMGGGVGVSVLGRFRVATEKAMFAMPETAIGLFPDVGSSHWLPHLSSGFGLYIGLTGARLFAADLIYSGIATHFIKSENLEHLETAIGSLPATGTPQEKVAKVREVLDDYSSRSGVPDSTKSVLIPNEVSIRAVFDNPPSVEDIIARLNVNPFDPWAVNTAKTLSKMSPRSLKLTFEQINRGRAFHDLGDCLKMEYRLVQGCMRAPDFSEGVRALLIDKDNKPQWNPPTLQEVTPAIIEEYFSPLPEGNEFDASTLN